MNIEREMWLDAMERKMKPLREERDAARQESAALSAALNAKPGWVAVGDGKENEFPANCWFLVVFSEHYGPCGITWDCEQGWMDSFTPCSRFFLDSVTRYLVVEPWQPLPAPPVGVEQEEGEK